MENQKTVNAGKSIYVELMAKAEANQLKAVDMKEYINGDGSLRAADSILKLKEEFYPFAGDNAEKKAELIELIKPTVIKYNKVRTQYDAGFSRRCELAKHFILVFVKDETENTVYFKLAKK